jgi:hypothetical protein
MAIKKRPPICDEELDRLHTELRLRNAELLVLRQQFDKMVKKFKKCSGESADSDE